MSISLGPFITCFLGIAFLSGYLYVILYKLNHTFIFGVKVIFTGIAIIFLRMCIPVNFPFTYTIYSTKLLLPLAKILYAPIGTSDYRFFDIILLCWLIVAIMKLCRLGLKTIKLHKYLEAYTVTENSKYSKLFTYVRKHCSKPVKIAVIPHNVSPAISGIFHPTMIFPESFHCFSEEELDYICMHESNHDKNHDLWMKALLEIISCIHWWNPFVYVMKKEYALTLELTNDYFLMKNHPNYNGTDYAELILKVAESTSNSSAKLSDELISFVRKPNSDLDVRISFALKNPPKRVRKRKPLIIHTMIIFTITILSLVFVTDYTARTPSLVIDNTYEMEPSNTYFIHTPDGYEIYVNGNYISTIIELPSDFQNYKIYEQGENIE